MAYSLLAIFIWVFFVYAVVKIQQWKRTHTTQKWLLFLLFFHIFYHGEFSEFSNLIINRSNFLGANIFWWVVLPIHQYCVIYLLSLWILAVFIDFLPWIIQGLFNVELF